VLQPLNMRCGCCCGAPPLASASCTAVTCANSTLEVATKATPERTDQFPSAGTTLQPRDTVATVQCAVSTNTGSYEPVAGGAPDTCTVTCKLGYTRSNAKFQESSAQATYTCMPDMNDRKNPAGKWAAVELPSKVAAPKDPWEGRDSGYANLQCERTLSATCPQQVCVTFVMHLLFCELNSRAPRMQR
jgi:hypothetical protein